MFYYDIHIDLDGGYSKFLASGLEINIEFDEVPEYALKANLINEEELIKIDYVKDISKDEFQEWTGPRKIYVNVKCIKTVDVGEITRFVEGHYYILYTDGNSIMVKGTEGEIVHFSIFRESEYWYGEYFETIE